MADDLSQHLRDLIVRLERQERHTHLHVPGPSVITVIHEAPEPVPEPEPEPEPVCVTFSDDFERTELGPDWVLPTSLVYDRGGSTATPQHLTIDAGGAIGPMTTGEITGCDFRPEVIPDDHFIESTFTLPAAMPCASCLHEVHWYMLFDPDTWTGISAWIVQNSEGPFGGFRFRFNLWDHGGVRVDESYDYFHEWPSAAHTLAMRFETLRTGRVRALIGGVPVDIGAGDTFYDFDVTGNALGDRLGISTRLDYFDVTAAVPRVEAVTGGCLALALAARAARTYSVGSPTPGRRPGGRVP